MIVEEVKRIIKEYKEAVEEFGVSDYTKERLKMHAFDEIVEQVEAYEKAKKELDAKKKISDADEAMRDAVAASKYLDDDDDTIAGRWHS